MTKKNMETIIEKLIHMEQITYEYMEGKKLLHGEDSDAYKNARTEWLMLSNIADMIHGDATLFNVDMSHKETFIKSTKTEIA